MVSHIKEQLSQFASKGKVLDLLTEGEDFNYKTLKAPPSDKIILDLFRKGRAEDVAHLASLTDSGEVLLTLARKEKRKSVLIEVLLNPCLPWEGTVELFKKSFEAKNEWLLPAIFEGRPRSETLKLVLEHRPSGPLEAPQMALFVKTLGKQGTPKAFKEALKLLEAGTPRMFTTLFVAACFRGSRVKTADLLEVYKAALPEYSDRWNHRENYGTESPFCKSAELLRRILNNSRELQIKALEINDPKLTLGLARAAANSKAKVDLTEVLNFVPRTRFGVVLEELIKAKHTFDLEQIKILREAEAFPRWTGRELKMTEEAALFLLDSPGLANSTFLSKVQESAFSSIRSSVGAVKAVTLLKSSITSEAAMRLDLDSLRAAGLSGVGAAAVLSKKAGCGYKLTPEELSLVAREGTNIHPSIGAFLNREDIEQVLKRVEADPTLMLHWHRMLWTLLHSNRKITKEQGSRLVMKGETNLLQAWYERTLHPKPCFADLRQAYFEADAEGKEKVKDYLKICSQGSDNPRFDVNMMLDVLVLDWSSMSDPVAEAVFQRLTEAFGEDAPSWQAALVFLEGWTGTIPELIETVRNL